ncbi:MAG: SIR2 family NAD-dependent protein deacylase [Candidatus Rariloculaceae bacterium]
MSDTQRPPNLPGSLAETLAKAERWVVMTGSGISAESGVPTFREAQTGLWEKYDPEELATPGAFEANPALVWDWYVWRRKLIEKAEPNAAHGALAALAELKPEMVLVTQNVDGLHQRAGSEKVVEFHGNIVRDRCFDCSRLTNQPSASEERPPRCEACNGLLRPDVVWFGEAIPEAALETAFLAAERCEVFLSVGTSAVVYPAAGLAQVAAERNATVVEINTNATPLTGTADYALQGLATFWLPAIASNVQYALANRQ